MLNKVLNFFGIAILVAGCFGINYYFEHQPPAEEESEPEIVTKVAVQVGQIGKATLHDYVHAYGQIALDPGNGKSAPASMSITAPSGGIITAANVVEGQQVSKGDVLFRLDSRVADLAIEKARQAVSFAEKNMERQEKLRKIDGTSDKLYLQAEQALKEARAEVTSLQTQRTLLTVSVPFSGTIVRLSAMVGQTVDMAQELAELRDLKRVVVTTDVPSREVSKLALGQQVEIDTEMPDSASTVTTGSLIGTIDYINPEVNSQTDTVTIRATIPSGSGLRSGRFVALRIITEVRPDCLVVPRESVYTDYDGRSTVSIVEGDVAKQIVVKTGLRAGAFIQIEGEGISEGATIVTSGSYALPEETAVHILTAANEEAGQ